MTRILLRDLEPGRKYYVQARVNSGNETSQWSQLWELQTTSDIMPPAPVTGLSWTVEGTAFKAVWAGPTTNDDGTPLFDFKDFQIKVYSPAAPGITATYYTAAARFDFPFESNLNAFGVPRAEVTIEVKARDNTGNLSSVVTATAENPPPADVQGLSVVGITDAVSLRWDANTEEDLKHYEVYHGTSSGTYPNLVYTGLATAFVFDSLATTEQFFAVRAVDVFNTPSENDAVGSATPKSSLSVDVDPPEQPTGVTVSTGTDDPVGGTSFIDVSWTASEETDLSNYSIRYSSSTSDWQYMNVPQGVTEARINNLRPGTDYYVAVSAIDYSGNASPYSNAGTYPITTAADEVAPDAPTGVTVGAGVTTMTIFWNTNEENDVANGRGLYQIQLDTVNTFNSSNLLDKEVGGTITSFSDLTTGTTYYVRVRAIDSSGNPGDWSSIVSGTPRFLSDDDLQDGTIHGDRLIVASLNGDRVLANTLDANSLKANSAFVNDLFVDSTLTMDSDGEIVSDDFSAGVSGWRLKNNALEINNGTISAAALSLQDSANIVHPAYADFEFQPTWYDDSLSAYATSGTADWEIATVPEITSRFGIQCLEIVKTGTSGVGADIYLNASNSAYNIDVEQNESYIYSAYVYNPSTTGSKDVELIARLADGNYVTATGESVSDSGSWQRISGIVNTASNNKIVLAVSLKTAGTIYVDGIQLERMMTGETSPSQWKPPSSTSIDGGIIRTGEIRSTAPANGLGGQPAWSINMQGNAQLGDALIRGRLVVGDPDNPSSDGVNSRIYSANYSAGTTGWIIRNDGYAEFRNLAVNSIKVTALDSPLQNSANARMYDYMQDETLWLQSGSVQQQTDPGAYSADSLFEFTGPGLILRNGTGVQKIAFDPTILYRVSARIRAYAVAQLNSNSTFETDTSGWTAYSSTTISRDTSKFYTGTASMKWEQNGSSVGLYGAGTTINVVPERTYSFSARILPNNTVIRDNLKMSIVWKNSGGSTISTTLEEMAPPKDTSGNPIPVDGTTWIQFNGQGVAPEGAVTAAFELQAGIASTATTGTLGWFDDVTVVTPPRVKVGLFGFDSSGNIIDYDFVDDATTPTKKHAMPTDYSDLSDWTASQYMIAANDMEVQIATGESSTTADWITLTGYIKGRGGYGSDGTFGLPGEAIDPYSPASVNQEVSFFVPYVEFDVAAGSTAQVDQFSIEAYENGAPSKISTTDESMKAITIEKIDTDNSGFDHALRFYTGDIDEIKPGLVGHTIDGDESDSPLLTVKAPQINKYGTPSVNLWERNPNYIYNATFTNGITGWGTTVGSTLDLIWETNDGFGDTNCLKVAAKPAADSSTGFNAYYDVSINGNPELVGEIIGASAYVKTNGATRNVKVQINFLDEAFGFIQGWYIEQELSTEWTRYAFVTGNGIPDNAAVLRIFAFWTNGANTDAIYIDDIQMEVNDVTSFRSASASKIGLDADVVRSRGSIVIAESDFALPASIGGTGFLGRPDAPRWQTFVAQSEGGTAVWGNFNYGDSDGQRISSRMSFYAPNGTEESSNRIYGLNDALYPGRSVITGPGGLFALSTVPDSSGDTSLRYGTRIYGQLYVDGTWPWIPLTPASGIVAPRPLGYFKMGGQVYLRGVAQGDNTDIARGTVIATLPVGYRPWALSYMSSTVWNANGSSFDPRPVVIQVNTNGEIILYSLGTAARPNLALDGLSFPLADIVPPGTGGGDPSDVTAPSAPSSFGITPVSSGVRTGTYSLSWTNPSTSDLGGVKVIWRSDRYPTVTIASSGKKTLTTDGSILTVSGAPSEAKVHTHSGLPVNKTIYYRLVAYDKSGNHSTYISGSRYLLASPVVITANSTDSYRLSGGGRWRNDGDDIYQGDWTGNDNQRGVYLYGTKIYDALSTGGVVRTPTKMTIYLSRLKSSHGYNSGIGINLRAHTYKTKPSGDPMGGMTNESNDGNNIVYLSRGENRTVTIPSLWYNNFVLSTESDRSKGLAVYGSSKSDFAILYGRSHSSAHGKLTIYHKG